MRRTVCAFIIVLVLICGLPVALVLGETGNSGVIVTVTATPEIAPPRRYYTETNLFGTETRFRISKTGEILKTIEATSENGMVTITIPRGTIALGKNGKRLKSLEAAVNESPPDPPEEASIIGLAYDFGPAGATFEPPITFSFSYDPDALPEGVAEEDLVIAYYDEATGEWVELDGVVDTENNTITASVSHFTTFAVIGRVPAPAPPEEEEVPPVGEEEEPEVVLPEPAAFSVSSLAVEPTGVKPGESVTISIVVANTGGESGSYTVVLKIDGVKEDEERVTVAAGGTETVAFSVTREDPGDYTVDVDGLSGGFTVILPIKPPGINWPLIGGIIGTLIVVGLLIYFLVVRRGIFFLGVAIREIGKAAVRRLIRLLTFLEIPLKLCLKQWRWLLEKFGKI